MFSLHLHIPTQVRLTRSPIEEMKPNEPPRQIGINERSNGPNFWPISVSAATGKRCGQRVRKTTVVANDLPWKAGHTTSEVLNRR